MKEVEVIDENGNLVETLERPDCWGELTESMTCADDCPYGEECTEATSDIYENLEDEDGDPE